MYIAFCDDHEAVINQLNQLITEFDKETHTKNTLVSFSTPSELYAHMQTNKVDIIFTLFFSIKFFICLSPFI